MQRSPQMTARGCAASELERGLHSRRADDRGCAQAAWSASRARCSEARLAADADADAGATAALEGHARRKPARYRGGRRAEARAVASSSSRPSTTPTDQNRSPRTAMMVLRATISCERARVTPFVPPDSSSARLQSGSLVWEEVWRGRPRQCGPTSGEPPCAARAHRRQRRSVRRRQALLEEARSDWRLARRTLEAELAHTGAAGTASARGPSLAARCATSSSARRRASTATPPSCSETPGRWRAGRRRPPPCSARHVAGSAAHRRLRHRHGVRCAGACVLGPGARHSRRACVRLRPAS